MEPGQAALVYGLRAIEKAQAIKYLKAGHYADGSEIRNGPSLATALQKLDRAGYKVTVTSISNHYTVAISPKSFDRTHILSLYTDDSKTWRFGGGATTLPDRMVGQ